MLKKIIKRLTCTHEDLYTITNVYGDPINFYDCRSIKQCKNCGKFFYHQFLDRECDRSNEFNYREELNI